MSPGDGTCGVGDGRVTTVSRRTALRAGTAVAMFAGSNWRPTPAEDATRIELSRRQRIAGMLLGSLFGDALGGPLEFVDDSRRDPHVLGARNWSDETRLDALGDRLPSGPPSLLSYRDLRPQTEPYGVWRSSAPPGTITDDSRLKIILLRSMLADGREVPASRSSIARELIHFRPHMDQPFAPEMRPLCEAGLREYRMAARWVLGDRDPSVARPLKRLWSGVDNCSGQMMLLPLAAALPGEPEDVYRRAFELNFVDTSTATDITSAIIAGLSAVLRDHAGPDTDVDDLWQRLETTMRDTDPFGYAQVPFVGRPLHHWMDLADRIVREADGSPQVAYRMLETDGGPRYFWDAHFTFLVPWTLLKLARFDAALAWHLTLDFGHDTDSYLQLLGGWLGAVYGPAAVGDAGEAIIRQSLAADYGEDIDVWVRRLDRLSQQNTDHH